MGLKTIRILFISIVLVISVSGCAKTTETTMQTSNMPTTTVQQTTAASGMTTQDTSAVTSQTTSSTSIASTSATSQSSSAATSTTSATATTSQTSASSASVLTREEAINIALAEVSGTVDRVETEIDNGRLVWKIRIVSGNTRSDIRIDDLTGQVTRIDTN